MKKVIVVVVFVVASLYSQDVVAQRQVGGMASNKAKSEEMMNTRLQMIKNELKLTDKQFVAFEPIYREYRKTLGRVSNQKHARVKKEDITNQNALKIISVRLSNTINVASVKQQYLWHFADVLEPVQINKLYNLEDRLAKEARKMIHQRK